MLFTKTNLEDAWIIDLDKRGDDRGFFARTMCVDEFAAHGLDTNFLQQNLSVSLTKGLVRGMHFQHGAFAESKLIRCLRGAICDIIVDLRPNSKTYTKWQAFELTEESYTQLFVPKGFAHGFQTLTERVEVSYLMGGKYAPAHESGVRYDDPAFAIKWPAPITLVSQKDLSWPKFQG